MHPALVWRRFIFFFLLFLKELSIHNLPLGGRKGLLGFYISELLTGLLVSLSGKSPFNHSV